MNDVKHPKYHIKGGEIFVTKEAGKVYRVVEGSVLVFVARFFKGKPGRRLFLAQFEEDALIPGFACTDGEEEFKFIFVALEEAVFEETSERRNFAGDFGLSLSDESEFESGIIEFYRLNAVREEGYIYKISKGAEDTRKQSIDMIKQVFDWQDEKFYGKNMPSGNRLYDCASLLCIREKIQIAPKEKITKSSGKDFTVEDIARVSHFVMRFIKLPDGWYKKDCGSFLAFREDNGSPICMLSSRSGKYRAYDGSSGKYTRVDKGLAEKINKQAIMFYRPFPDRKISLPSLIAFGFGKVYPSDIIRAAILAVLGVLIGLLVPTFNELIYDRFIPLGDTGGLLQVGLIILAFSLGNIVFTVVKNLSIFRSMSSMEYAVQSATIDRLFNLPESFIRQYDSAVLGGRAIGISRVYSIVSESAVRSVLSALLSLAYITRMVNYSGVLTRWAVFMLGISAFVSLYIGIKQVRYEKEKTKVDQRADSFMFQYISRIEKIRLSSAENRALVQYLKEMIKSGYLNYKKEKLTVLAEVIIEASGLVFSMVFYWLMINKELGLSIGSFMGFIVAFGSLYGAVFEIIQNFFVYNKVYPLYEMARPILETLPENIEDARIPDEITGEIEINNVSFGYGDGQVGVLKDINLHIKKGEYIGIVGSSGSGKSTLLKLLLGFEKPQKGKIYYDGQDIDELDKRELRKKFGVVLQEGGLIGGDIYDNLTITSADCTMERVNEVVEQVGLMKDISEMPMGLYTMINEEGRTLSGGQIQRILIGRAIMGKPRIIFLDEATSALDNVTQSQVIETLENIDATKVVIAHRLSTVVNCDRIIVMNEGRVVEEGTYEELMSKKGRFHELAARQVV